MSAAAGGGGSLLPGAGGGSGGAASAAAGGAGASGTNPPPTPGAGASAPESGEGSGAGAAGGDWKTKGYEAEYLATAHGGKYKTVADLVKGTEEFGTLVNQRSEEAKSAQAKAAEFEQRFGQLAEVIGAPKDPTTGEPAPYDFGWSPEADLDPELTGQFEGMLRKFDLSQNVAKEAAQLLETYAAAQALGNREAELFGAITDYGLIGTEAGQFSEKDVEAAMADPTKFGETAVGKAFLAKAADLEKFWVERFGENKDLTEAMYGVAHLRDGVRFLELLRSDLTRVQNGRVAGTSGPETREQILAEAANDPNFFSKPENNARLEAAIRRQLGDGADKPVRSSE